MAHAHHSEPQIVEQYHMPARTRRYLLIGLAVGLFLTALGAFLAYRDAQDHPYHANEVTYTPQTNPASRHEAIANEKHGAARVGGLNNSPEDVRPGETHPQAHTSEHVETPAEGVDTGEDIGSTPGPTHDQAAGHHGPDFGTRMWANFLVNNVYFVGVAVLALFFIMVQNVSDAGWYVIVKRVLESMTFWLPIGGALLLVGLLGVHSLYHWADSAAVAADPILLKKQAWLNVPGFAIRMVVYLVVWMLLAFFIRRESLREDVQGGLAGFNRSKAISAGGLFLFGLSFSAAAWDWVMSVDPHWFSTMFGVYLFASMLVSSLALLTIVAIVLHKSGFLPAFNESHMHDLGKFVFAFSIFWTYIWFCQFLLIWYANIPEEGAYYYARINPYSPYKVWFFLLPVVNFAVPFLALMPAATKRRAYYLSAVCGIILLGHWLDVWMMVFPGTMKEAGRVGLLELGMWLTYLCAFLLVTGWALTRAPLVPKHHPYLRETLLHSYH